MAIDSINPIMDPMVVQSGAQQAVKPVDNDASVQNERINNVKETDRARNAGAAVEPAAESAPVSRDQLEAVIEQLNELMQDSKRSLSFRVDDDLDKLVVSVVNPETEEVIRQMPSEESLKFAKSLEGVLGIIFNEHA